MNDSIRGILKQIVNLQNKIKRDELNHKSKCMKVYSFSEYSLPIFFKEICMKDIHH